MPRKIFVLALLLFVAAHSQGSLIAARWGLDHGREVAGFVAQSQGRLVGVGSVNIARPMDAVREVRRCVRELGFKGIFPSGSKLDAITEYIRSEVK